MAARPSPLAPERYPDMPAVAGVRLATAEAGIRYRDRTDVLVALFDGPAAVAGVLTRSRCASAPVEWCRERLAGGRAGALVVNSGNANAFTGMKGREAARRTAELMARAGRVGPDEVFLASTGVIGEPLDAGKFAGVLDDAVRRASPEPWMDAARAIMTTDTFPKLATRRVEVGGEGFVLNGIAKGAGMIAPDMATMLSFLFTDAPVAAPALQALLGRAVRDSFNAITVDGDTSTSDTVLLFATAGTRDGAVADPADRRLRGFARALEDLCRDLAQQVVRDGEGATKFVTVRIEGAVSKPSARRIARSIANSPLVKTAIAGEDANWGRVVMAVGKAGEPAERDRLAISFGDIRVARDGARDPSYDEAQVSAYMKGRDIRITVDLGLGRGTDTVWTCDLTHDYVSINGDYRS